MKVIFSIFLMLAITLAACAQGSGNNQNTGGNQVPDGENIAIIVQIGNRAFPARLFNNATTRAWVERMPMTLNMIEMGGYEKYHNLPYTLPTNTQRVGSVSNGDLMLWQNNCIVIFYQNRSTQYSYTRLGAIENPTGLAEALGRGNVTVTFSISN
jgi:hypothetical protein